MNCKPGDLAIVVRGKSGKNDGKIVRVVRRAANAERIGRFVARAVGDEVTGVSWLCSGDGLVTAYGEGPLQEWVFRDKALRRIDNPGDDAVDEVIQRLGTPHKETA